MGKTLKYVAILSLCGSSAFSMTFKNETDKEVNFLVGKDQKNISVAAHAEKKVSILPEIKSEMDKKNNFLAIGRVGAETFPSTWVQFHSGSPEEVISPEEIDAHTTIVCKPKDEFYGFYVID